ncbi:MAG: hypothetical protein AAF517_17175, partial [Planctomycetota bacterium]
MKTSIAILATAICFLFIGSVGYGQVELGKVGKYHEIDPNKLEIDAKAYPELSLDDLRKISMFSKLTIRGRKAVVADAKHMRSVAAHPQDRSLLVVTSDHFRFTTFKNATPPLKGTQKAERKQLGFLWIKHATKESAPDGKPWLKDLILLPIKKNKVMVGSWPFHRKYSPRRAELPLFITQLDPRPEWGEFPTADKCVVGIFKSGSSRYLVLDVFGGFSWWGKIGYSEYVSLRGKNQAAIDAFHGGPVGKKKKRARPANFVTWRNPQMRTVHAIVSRDRKEGGT